MGQPSNALLTLLQQVRGLDPSYQPPQNWNMSQPGAAWYDPTAAFQWAQQALSSPYRQPPTAGWSQFLQSPWQVPAPTQPQPATLWNFPAGQNPYQDQRQQLQELQAQQPSSRQQPPPNYFSSLLGQIFGGQAPNWGGQQPFQPPVVPQPPSDQGIGGRLPSQSDRAAGAAASLAARRGEGIPMQELAGGSRDQLGNVVGGMNASGFRDLQPTSSPQGIETALFQPPAPRAGAGVPGGAYGGVLNPYPGNYPGSPGQGPFAFPGQFQGGYDVRLLNAPTPWRNPDQQANASQFGIPGLFGTYGGPFYSGYDPNAPETNVQMSQWTPQRLGEEGFFTQPTLSQSLSQDYFQYLQHQAQRLIGGVGATPYGQQNVFLPGWGQTAPMGLTAPETALARYMRDALTSNVQYQAGGGQFTPFMQQAQQLARGAPSGLAGDLTGQIASGLGAPGMPGQYLNQAMQYGGAGSPAKIQSLLAQFGAGPGAGGETLGNLAQFGGSGLPGRLQSQIAQYGAGPGAGGQTLGNLAQYGGSGDLGRMISNVAQYGAGPGASGQALGNIAQFGGSGAPGQMLSNLARYGAGPGASGETLSYMAQFGGSGFPGQGLSAISQFGAGPGYPGQAMGLTSQFGGTGVPSKIQSLMAQYGVGPGGGGQTLEEMAQTGAPITALPAWQAAIEAQQRNIQQNMAQIGSRMAATGNLLGTPYQQALADYGIQTSRDQNAMLAQAQQQALEAAMGRRFGAGNIMQGFQGQAAEQMAGRQFGATQQMNQAQQQALMGMSGQQQQAALAMLQAQQQATGQLSGQQQQSALAMLQAQMQALGQMGGAQYGSAQAMQQAQQQALAQMGGYQQQAALAMQQAQQQAANQLAGTQFGAAQLGLGSQMDALSRLFGGQVQGIQLGGQLGGAQQNAYQNLLGLGNQMGMNYQGMDQAAIDRQLQEFMRTRPEYNPMLGQLFAGATTFPGLVTPKVAAGGIGSMIGQAAIGAVPDILKNWPKATPSAGVSGGSGGGYGGSLSGGGE